MIAKEAQNKNTIGNVMALKLSIKSILCLVIFSVGLQGCAVMAPKTNDQTMRKISGSQFVLSVPEKKVDFNAVKATQSQDKSVLRLVDESFYRLAFRLNGSTSGLPLSVQDPSVLIMNNLAKYYGQMYDVKAVAKGTIKNIDPVYLSKALKQGEYVLDVRLVELNLVGDKPTQRFYLQAAYQLRVVDLAAGKNLIEDKCSFSEPEKANSIKYFSGKRGQNISSFLQRHAGECLRLFAKGTPLNTQSQPAKATPVKSTPKSKPQPKPKVKTQRPKAVSSNGNSSARFGLGASITTFKDVSEEQKYLNSYDTSIALAKPVSNTMGLVLQAEASVHKDSAFPTFGEGSIYGGGIGVGASYHKSGNFNSGVVLMAKAKIGQYRQNNIYLSTNSLGLELKGYRPLYNDFLMFARYGFDAHIGKTQESNVLSHQLGVGLEYQFGR